MNSVNQYLIPTILKLEDISAKAAEQLVDALNIIIARGPKLFSDPNEVCLYVESWNKLKELVFMLSSNLMDISDRWADAKGPLALQFEAVEVRQMIRALFSNTDRRAAVLSRI